MFLHDGFDFMRFKGPRHVIGLHASIVCHHFACGQQGAGGHCFCARGFDVMAAYAATVHDLQHDQAPFGMHSLGHCLPALDVFSGGNARLSAIRLTVGAGPGALGHNQAGIAALSVVLGHQGIGHTLCICAVARHGRHHDSIFEMQIAQDQGLEKFGHSAHSHFGCGRAAAHVAQKLLKWSRCCHFGQLVFVGALGPELVPAGE